MASTAEFANEVDAATDLYDLWSVSRDLLDEGHWPWASPLARVAGSIIK